MEVLCAAKKSIHLEAEICPTDFFFTLNGRSVNVLPSWEVVQNYNKGTKREAVVTKYVQEQETVSQKKIMEKKRKKKTSRYASGEMRKKRT